MYWIVLCSRLSLAANKCRSMKSTRITGIWRMASSCFSVAQKISWIFEWRSVLDFSRSGNEFLWPLDFKRKRQFLTQKRNFTFKCITGSHYFWVKKNWQRYASEKVHTKTWTVRVFWLYGPKGWPGCWVRWNLRPILLGISHTFEHPH